MTPSIQDNAPLLEAMMNLTKFHREHEKFYASSPREFAVTLQRHARTLHALADQWSTTEASTRAVLSPYEGAEDLNSPAALQLDGVLFLEGEGRPAEISHLIRDLRNAAEDQKATGEWLAKAMESSWAVAAALIEIDVSVDFLQRRNLFRRHVDEQRESDDGEHDADQRQYDDPLKQAPDRDVENRTHDSAARFSACKHDPAPPRACAPTSARAPYRRTITRNRIPPTAVGAAAIDTYLQPAGIMLM